MVHEADGVEGAVLVLVTPDPGRGLIEHALVDVHQVCGLSKGLEHEGGEPHAALLVALPEGGEAAVIAPVGQLPLVAGYHQFLSLGHYLRLDLAALLKVLHYVDVRGQQDHVLLAAAEGHLDEALQPLDRLGQIAGGHRQIHPARASHSLKRYECRDHARLSLGEDEVVHHLTGDTLRRDDDGLYHGVSSLSTAGGDLDLIDAQSCRADHE